MDDETPAPRRGPPDLTPPQTRAPLSPRSASLVARAQARDRIGEYEQRRVALDRDVERRRRRRPLLVAAVAFAVAVVVGAATEVLATAGVPLGEPARYDGATVGLAAAVIVFVTVLSAGLLAPRLAARRGPEAWDWQKQRHVLFGNPSARVEQFEAKDNPLRTSTTRNRNSFD